MDAHKVNPTLREIKDKDVAVHNHLPSLSPTERRK